MTSLSDRPTNAFVWVWLPGESEPVVAGRVAAHGDGYRFAYGASYLARPDAVSLYSPELPLDQGWIEHPELRTRLTGQRRPGGRRHRKALPHTRQPARRNHTAGWCVPQAGAGWLASPNARPRQDARAAPVNDGRTAASHPGLPSAWRPGSRCGVPRHRPGSGGAAPEQRPT